MKGNSFLSAVDKVISVTSGWPIWFASQDVRALLRMRCSVSGGSSEHISQHAGTHLHVCGLAFSRQVEFAAQPHMGGKSISIEGGAVDCIGLQRAIVAAYL